MSRQLSTIGNVLCWIAAIPAAAWFSLAGIMGLFFFLSVATSHPDAIATGVGTIGLTIIGYLADIRNRLERLDSKKSV